MENYQESGSVKDLKNQLSHRQGYYPLYQPPTYLGTISVQTFDVALTGIAVVAFLTYALRLLVTAIRGTGRKKRSASNGNIPEHFPPLSDFMETLPKFAPEFGITGLELLVDFWTHEDKFQICSQYTRLGNSTGSENYQRALDSWRIFSDFGVTWIIPYLEAAQAGLENRPCQDFSGG